MTAWHEGRLVAFDVESTGIDVHQDRVVTAAVVHITPGQRPRALTWVIDPGISIPAEASAVHGWTNQKIAAHRDHRGRALQPPGALFEIAGQVALAMSQGVPLVAFNAAYDLTLLEAECRRHDVPTLAERLSKTGIRGVVDPYVIDKHYSRRKNKCTCGCGATSRQLPEQCKPYKVGHTGAHDAGGDALATIRLLGRQVAAYPELARMTLTKLHQSQIGWRAQQCTSLRGYFDRMGIAHDGVPGDWPLIPTPVGAAS